MAKGHLVFIGGFLNQKKDWNYFSKNKNFISYFWQEPKIFISSLKEWGEQFNQWVLTIPKPRYLIAYSRGGRLALHALEKNSSLWEKVILISTHPGLKSNKEKQKRFLEDQKLADYFLRKEWSELMLTWEKQPVFANSTFQFIREEKNYNRLQLAHEIKTYSLGLQENFSLFLKSLKIPLLYLYGEKDVKYKNLACHFPLQQEVLNASHRVLWENPLVFQKIVTHFLKI